MGTVLPGFPASQVSSSLGLRVWIWLKKERLRDGSEPQTRGREAVRGVCREGGLALHAATCLGLASRRTRHTETEHQGAQAWCCHPASAHPSPLWVLARLPTSISLASWGCKGQLWLWGRVGLV